MNEENPVSPGYCEPCFPLGNVHSKCTFRRQQLGLKCDRADTVDHSFICPQFLYVTSTHKTGCVKSTSDLTVSVCLTAAGKGFSSGFTSCQCVSLHGVLGCVRRARCVSSAWEAKVGRSARTWDKFHASQGYTENLSNQKEWSRAGPLPQPALQRGWL